MTVLREPPVNLIRIREGFGTGIINSDVIARPFVRGAENSPIRSSTSERLQEQIRTQLEEQRNERVRRQEQTHNIIRGNRSNFMYFEDNNPLRDIEFDRIYMGDFDGDRTMWRSPSLGEESCSITYFSEAKQELLDALTDAIHDTMREYNLQPEQLMFLLSVEAYQILSRGQRHLEQFYGVDIHVVYDQIDLYKVVAKGYRGFRIAEQRVRDLQ